MGNVGNYWDEQQNEQRGNQYGDVMPATFRDAEPGEDPSWAKINFHLKSCSRFLPGADGMISQ
jgi:hypothetical protein